MADAGPGYRRQQSISLYTKMCPVIGGKHDWRYASHAPGWLVYDECVICEACKQRAIAPLEKT